MNNMNSISLSRRRHVSSVLLGLKEYLPQKPKKGWISEIRSLLMLSTRQLAERVGVNQSTISHLESAERNGSITLSSLEKLASALHCEVRYVFVPLIPLDEQVDKQGEAVLLKEEKEIEHTMALEDQGTSDRDSIRNVLKKEMFIQKLGSKIWDL